MMDTAHNKHNSNNNKSHNILLNMIWWGLGVGFILGCTFNEINGYDWYKLYYPMAQQVDPGRLFSPLWLYIVLKPLTFFSPQFGFFLFLLLNLGAIWLASKLTGASRWGMLLAFPAFWVFWYGQIDGLVMLGAALGYWAVKEKRGLWLGAAFMLLLVKPHIGGPIALFYFLSYPNWRSLIVCAGVVGVTLVLWGVDWPYNWLVKLFDIEQQREFFSSQATNISLFPYGLAAWLTALLPLPFKDRVLTVISATFLSVPYAAVYSLLVLFAYPVPWPAYLIASAPYLLGALGYPITSFVPILILVFVVYRNREGIFGNMFDTGGTEN